MDYRAPALACVASLCACVSFDLPDAPASTIVTVSPEAAYAGQAITLRFSGVLPSLDDTYVAIGGQVARKLSVGTDSVVVEVPRLDGCARQLPVEIGALEGANATLGYLGAGHPGASRVRLAGQQPLAFQASTLRAFGSGVLMAGEGTLVAAQSSPGPIAGSILELRHADDHVVALEPLGGCSGAAYMGRHGGFGVLGSLTRVELDTSGPVPSAPPAPDLEGTLLSAVFDSGASLAAGMSTCSDGATFEGLALGLRAEDLPLGLQGSAEGTIRPSPIDPAHPILEFLRGRRGMVALAGADQGLIRYLAVRGGESPALTILDPAGSILAEHALPQEAILTPLSIASAAESSGGTVVAVSWRFEGGEDPQDSDEKGSPDAGEVWPPGYDGSVPGFDPDAGMGERPGDDGGFAPPDRESDAGLSSAPVDAGDLPLDGGVPPETRIASDGISIAWLPSPGTDSAGGAGLWLPADAPFADIAIRAKDGPVEVFAVDGRRSALWHYSAEQAALKSSEVVSLPAPASRVAALDDRVVVSLADGNLVALAGAPLQQQAMWRIPLGAKAIGSRTPASCSEAPVLVAAGELSSLVIAPLSAGRTATFVPGLDKPFAVESVAVEKAGAEQAYYVAANEQVLTVSEPIAQAHARSSSTARSVEVGLSSARALTVWQAEPGEAWIVVGREGGLAGARLAADLSVSALPPRDACGDVRALAPWGDRVLGLVGPASSARLCTADPRTLEGTTGEALPSTWSIERLAVSASVSDPGAERGSAPIAWLVGFDGDSWLLAAVRPGAESEPEPLALSGFQESMPDRMEVASAAASPDGRRLFVGLRGDEPGVLVVDPLCHLELAALDAAAPEAAKKRDECRAALTTIALSAAPLGFSLSEDGARVIAVLEDDSLAILE